MLSQEVLSLRSNNDNPIYSLEGGYKIREKVARKKALLAELIQNLLQCQERVFLTMVIKIHQEKI